MEGFMYWTGVAFWCCVSLYLLVLSYEFGKGAAVAADWMRWRIAVCREHGFEINWRAFPRTFCARWYDFTLSAAFDHTWTGEHGSWRGFRKWTVTPSKTS